MALQPGTVLQNRYRIERVLGHGGMGAVYLATDESLSGPCAVKENLNSSQDAERLFRREATLLASLRHPNLPRVTNHFVLGDEQYLVMDYVEGEDLKEHLAHVGPLPEADVVRWAIQICGALTYLHEHTPPIIHRDIKPANIKLMASGEAMLVDFGIAKISAPDQKTQTNIVGLTPGFAPPEQYGMGGRTDGRTDEYALASTLYILLTNQPPPDAMERLLSNKALPPLWQLRPDVSAPVAAAITRALEVKPDDRFPTVAAFRAALLGQAMVYEPTRSVESARATVKQSAALGQMPTQLSSGIGPSPTLIAPPQTQTPPRRNTWLWWLLGLAGLGGIAVIGLVLGVVFGPRLFAPAATPTSIGGSQTRPDATRTRAPATATIAPPTVTQTPLPPTETPTVEPSVTPAPPTETASAAPTETATATTAPVVVGTPVGGGGRIAFISNRDGQHFQIYTMNADGSDVRQITFDPVDKWSKSWLFEGTQLAWSPDGTKLLYVAAGDAANGTDIWMINADGSNPIDLTASEAGRVAGDDYQPTWCADGTIAFTSLRTNNVPQLFTMTLANPIPRNNSAQRNSPREYDVSYFAKCQRMIFVTTVNGTPELWRWFPDLNSYRVFRSDIPLNAKAEDPAVSPDGAWVAYTRRAPDGNEIILASVTNRLNNQQITNTKNNSAPAWSPDGMYLVFVSKRDGNPEIYRTLAGGQEQINLTNNAAIDTDPVWQPAAP
jgi:serine/threonine protein kinase